MVGLFIWPVWFGMDFQGAGSREVDALNSRRQYLAVLAEQRNCGAPATAPPAVAMTQPVAPPASQPVGPAFVLTSGPGCATINIRGAVGYALLFKAYRRPLQREL